MITTEYLQSGGIWYYEGLGYKLVKRGLMWAIEGATAGHYGIVDWFGETMIQVTVLNFGESTSMYLEYQDMSTSNIK